MDRNSVIAEDLGSTTLTVDANPMPLRLPSGSALFPVQGEIWLTQEGVSDDVVLSPGRRYDVRGSRPIVVSAIKGNAVVYVAKPADARADAAEDLYSFLAEKARRLRDAERAGMEFGVRAPLGRLARWALGLVGGRRVLSN